MSQRFLTSMGVLAVVIAIMAEAAETGHSESRSIS